MTIGPIGLIVIVFSSMCFGCCIGMGVMAMCRVSAEDRIEGYQPEGGDFDTSNPPQGGSGVPELRRETMLFQIRNRPERRQPYEY